MKKSIPFFILITATIAMLPSCQKSAEGEYIGTFRGTYINSGGNECEDNVSYLMTLTKCEKDYFQFRIRSVLYPIRNSILYRKGYSVEGVLNVDWSQGEEYDVYFYDPIYIVGSSTESNGAIRFWGEYTQTWGIRRTDPYSENDCIYKTTGTFEINPK